MVRCESELECHFKTSELFGWVRRPDKKFACLITNRKERREHKRKTRRSLGFLGALLFSQCSIGVKISSCFHFPVPE